MKLSVVPLHHSLLQPPGFLLCLGESPQEPLVPTVPLQKSSPEAPETRLLVHGGAWYLSLWSGNKYVFVTEQPTSDQIFYTQETLKPQSSS